MRRWVFLFVIYYCLRSDGVYLIYQGMDQPTIDNMLKQQSLSCTYISSGTWTQAMASQQTAQQTKQSQMLATRNAALATAKSATATPQSRIDALIQALGF